MPADSDNKNELTAHWIGRLKDSEVDEPQWNEAVEAITELGASVVPTLLDAAGRSGHSVSLGLRRAIHPMGADAVKHVVEALGHGDYGIRHESALFLVAAAQNKSLTPDIVPALIAGLQDPESDVRFRVAQALLFLGEMAEEAIPALIQALRDPDSEVRDWAAAALGAIGPKAKQAVPALTNALDDEDETVRDTARDSLDQIQAS